MSKRDAERKIREEQEATAHVFQEFLQSFQSSYVPKSKTFVKSGVLHPKEKQDEGSQRGILYNPKPVIKHDDSAAIKAAIECARLLKETKPERSRGHEKPKSNLEALKEELKLRHTAKEVKNKQKDDACCSGLSDADDPSTTNLFVANLSQKVTENDLITMFGAYGPLASVKIMWPRGEERDRNTNCGFVAFMSRKDGERALSNFRRRNDMRVGWAKCVEIPSHPIYIPPELLKLILPPPQTGLPFNAQPLIQSYEEPTSDEEMGKLLHKSVVKVTVPVNKKILMAVHRMVEFVAREGPLFEALIMNREMNNPLYQFLFENRSSTHTYYRWKLYSVLHGETQTKWSSAKFRMFTEGAIWIPPEIHDYSQGMPESLLQPRQKVDKDNLSESQSSRLVNYIQNLTLRRTSIAEAMTFVLAHRKALTDIFDILVDSFRNIRTKATKKIARLYLLSDILYNLQKLHTTQKPLLKPELRELIPEIFENLLITWNNIEKPAEKDEFQCRVQKVLKSWNLWKMHDIGLLRKLEKMFTSVHIISDNDEDSGTEGPLDGNSLIQRSIKNKSDCVVCAVTQVESKPQTLNLSAFVASKWETVDPEQVEAQAMSTQKMYDLECQKQIPEKASKPLSEHERNNLRSIEIMVIQLQEELESGKRKRNKFLSMEQELCQYREFLMKKMKRGTLQIMCSSSSDSSSDEDARKAKKAKNERSEKKKSNYKETKKMRK